MINRIIDLPRNCSKYYSTRNRRRLTKDLEQGWEALHTRALDGTWNEDCKDYGIVLRKKKDGKHIVAGWNKYEKFTCTIFELSTDTGNPIIIANSLLEYLENEIPKIRVLKRRRKE